MQSELLSSVSEDYAQQFLAAVRADVKVKRNESAIAADEGADRVSGGS